MACVCGKSDCTIPYGLCHCGCESHTQIVTSKQGSPRNRHFVGQPKMYIHNHHMRLSPVEYIVEDRGYKTPCWIWQRHRDKKGYGKKGKGKGQRGVVRAHRWYYEQKHGPIPEGFDLDHLCNQPPCVNPDHLEPVTNRVNTQRGKTAAVTPEIVIEIRRLLSAGVARKSVSASLRVSLPVVNQIAAGKTWGNI